MRRLWHRLSSSYDSLTGDPFEMFKEVHLVASAHSSHGRPSRAYRAAETRSASMGAQQGRVASNRLAW